MHSPSNWPKRIPAAQTEVLFHAARELYFPELFLTIHLDRQIDADRLGNAVLLSIKAEPILGCRLQAGWFSLNWVPGPDLQLSDLFQIVESTDSVATVAELLSNRRDPDLLPTVQITVIRGPEEIVLMRMDHRVGDAASLLEYSYLVASIYHKLEDNPGFVPEARLVRDRSRQPAWNRFDSKQQREILRYTNRRGKECQLASDSWFMPVATEGENRTSYRRLILSPERMNALFRAGVKRKATVSQLLWGATIVAARRSLPTTPGKEVLSMMLVNLRRYLPAEFRSAILNMIGVTNATIPTETAMSLDETVDAITSQMRQEHHYLGMCGGALILECHWLFRRIMGMIPLSVLSWLIHHNSAQMAKKESHGLLIFTDTGEIDADRLFPGVVDARFDGSSMGVPRRLIVVGSSFRGEYTCSIPFLENVHPVEYVDSIMETLDSLLPDATSEVTT